MNFNLDVNFTDFKYGVLNHYENYDGTGYFGLSEAKIPICSRVVMICDYLDALLEKRTYKESFSFEKSISVMKKNSHVFDTNIFKIFLKNFDNFEKFHKKL